MKQDPRINEITDALNAELAWSPGLGWLRWDGKVWDEVGQDGAVEAVRQYVVDSGLRPLGSARQIRDTVHQLTGPLAIDVQALDPDPDLLNVQNGVVNLRTGELRPHSRARLMTKMAAVDYDPGARSDTWDQVLSAIPDETRDQLQTHIAWSVAGGPLDQTTLIHGPGVSGKTTFMQAVRSALGTYSLATDGELLNLRSPFDVISLRGVRLILMEDAALEDMDRVKRLTSMDEFSARQIQQNTITFKRTHSVLLATSLNPSDLAKDEGTRRRLRPAEFTALREPVQGLHLRIREPEALRAVLRWIVEGAVRGYAAG